EDEDGGEIDVGEVADRQALVGHHPEDEQRRHQEGGGHGPSKEDRGEVQGAPSGGAASSGTGVGPAGSRSATRTSIPGRRRSWPLTTTRSPGASPSTMARRPPSAGPGRTARISTVLSSGRTTKTKGPSGPTWSAAEGTTGTSSQVRTWSQTSVGSPGQKVSSALSKTALRRMVPVAGSTVLSMKSSLPSRARSGWPRGCARTVACPARIASRTAGRRSAGIEKRT